MARNKYPEETLKQILSVSLNLFIKKGYENTSIQDITDGLGGLTKGAIYHHFKSKEDIMVAVLNQLYKDVEDKLAAVRDDKGLNGLEKLRQIIRVSLNHDPAQLEMMSTAPNLLENPKILVAQLKSVIEDSVPNYIQPIIEQGVIDGSIKTDYPLELSEMVMLLSNLWLSPMIFEAPPENMLRRCRFFMELLNGIGIDLLDEQMVEQYEKFYRLYSEKY
ncbi:TetR/AcrR family transcriptional regulator [Heyndrickxia oleronia]|uniref:TetR family transcriptional regulator n=1 Tax=Heyndrickxia oleronia TaxID=38875 RepID=A0A8E2LCU9_9BACI|nr:TetR/AcrR family transcriptional regulator [Heyndrickxia oleronia]NYV68762.1 TetR/AcrR family transcriptional regulator [Bacillus sp. Gen3]OJH17175.1 TetR family transcriptional regulator [Bacillus obstructivus]MEC1376916.1 TetR/AcrR family transcriptional regulator [Heyndrickxia oleronia]OOP65962.1 TetR family transcriptional regulator [Heyndrickxia oleronia]QQZ03756.1 TetR/AcrR family transcriptional regulator [Heyndrickxia oleronia]